MSVIRSILVCCFIGLAVNSYAMDVQRILGEYVHEKDKKTWKQINDPAEVEDGELVAVYDRDYYWKYGKVTLKPGIGKDFTGMASFKPEAPYWSFAINFRINVRKLLAQVSVQNKETPAKHENVD